MQKLSAALIGALKDRDLVKRFREISTEPMPADKATPEAAQRTLTSEIDRWAPIIKAAGEYADQPHVRPIGLMVMDPAGFTYAGFALRDCIKGAGLPYVEVHISSMAKRNIHFVLSDVAEGMITGFGIHSYILSLDAMLEILKKRTMGR